MTDELNEVGVIQISYRERILAIAKKLDEYVKKYDQAKNSRAVFTCAYATITHIIAEKIDRVHFKDPAWCNMSYPLRQT